MKAIVWAGVAGALFGAIVFFAAGQAAMTKPEPVHSHHARGEAARMLEAEGR